MNVTVIKKSGNKEVINRVELSVFAASIKNGLVGQAVRKLREV